MNTRKTNLGGLSCFEVDSFQSGGEPQLISVLCHGFGASGADLVPLANEILNEKPELAYRVRFVFPAAPISLDRFGIPGGSAWWLVNVEGLAAAIMRGELRDQTEDQSSEMSESRRMLTDLIDDVQRQTNLPANRFVIGGFSQGAVLATDVALRLPNPPAGLCIMSGTLACDAIWRDLARHRQNMSVIQSHGRQDPLLPYVGAVWLKDMLLNAGLSVDFVDFDGGHTIPYPVIGKLASLLGGIAN